MRVTVAPFTSDHLEDAAALLAARHRRDREQVSDLAAEYEDAAATLPLLQELWAEEGASGVVALAGGRVHGYLLATPALGSPNRAFAGFVHPRSVDISQQGHATAPGREGTLFPRLYAAMAEQWVRQGLIGHYITTPSHAEASTPWWELGFGQYVTAGLRVTPAAVAAESSTSVALEFRKATMDDERALQDAATGLFRSFADPPIFIPFLPETAASRDALVSEYLADAGCSFWLALSGDRLVSFMLIVEPTSPLWHQSPLEAPAGCVYLFLAYTAPEARGSGVGASLVDHALACTRAAGYDSCLAHWLTASRAARFWRGCGFQPVSYWMRRLLDERSIWASGQQ